MSGHDVEMVTEEVKRRPNRKYYFRALGRLANTLTLEPTLSAVEGKPEEVHKATVKILVPFVARGRARL